MSFITCLVIYTIIFVMSLRYVKSGFNNDYLSIESTRVVRGGVAWLVVLHHIVTRVDLPKIFTPLTYIGFILVAIFFFYSGYGLMFAYSRKANYLEDFLKKHLLNILIPYWLTYLLLMIYKMFQGEKIAVDVWIKIMFACYDLWFITSIIIFYIIFYISYRYFRNNADKVFWGLTIIYCISCILLELHSSWTASISAFILGMVWCKNKAKIDMYIRTQYTAKLCLGVVFFSVMFVGRLGLMYVGIDNNIIQCIIRNLVSCLFVVLVMLVLQKIQVHGKLFYISGILSLEIYIVHRAIIEYISIGIIPYILITILGVYGLHKVSMVVKRQSLNVK